MFERRAFLGLVVSLPTKAFPRESQLHPFNTRGSYRAFLSKLRDAALVRGIKTAILDAALALDGPNAQILTFDQRQPEFTMTWSHYRQRVLTDKKIQAGRSAYKECEALLTAIWQRYRVDPRIVVGIWGLESDFGARTGQFGVIDALATLAYDGRRAAFFNSELINALQILQRGDIELDRMLGSYAGAMGQPQFMPSSYLRYAVDFDGDGRRDIWSSDADVLASIANYLSESGWIAGAPWAQPVFIPPNLDAEQTGGNIRRSLESWMRLGVRRADGTAFSRGDAVGAVLLPGGSRGDAFMVYTNFDVIRRYNASDFYSLAVGLLGIAIG